MKIEHIFLVRAKNNDTLVKLVTDQKDPIDDSNWLELTFMAPREGDLEFVQCHWFDVPIQVINSDGSSELYHD